MATVTFPDGVRVGGRGVGDPTPDPPPERGLYLDDLWDPSWPARKVDWPDLGVPANLDDAARAICDAFAAAQDGVRVEVGCGAGLGRTGTVLACMAFLAGIPADQAIEWVRANYERQAIETQSQERWVQAFAERIARERFASYLCLVYHEARNVRHLIKGGYLDAGPYLSLRDRLTKNRDEAWVALQDLRAAAIEREASPALKLFVDRFGLTLEDLLGLFADARWKDAPSYGGNRWVEITRSVIELRDALVANEQEAIADLLHRIPALRHNNGLVGEKLRSLDTTLTRESPDR
jgi:hypothetical protein